MRMSHGTKQHHAGQLTVRDDEAAVEGHEVEDLAELEWVLLALQLHVGEQGCVGDGSGQGMSNLQADARIQHRS